MAHIVLLFAHLKGIEEHLTGIEELYWYAVGIVYTVSNPLSVPDFSQRLLPLKQKIYIYILP